MDILEQQNTKIWYPRLITYWITLTAHWTEKTRSVSIETVVMLSHGQLFAIPWTAAWQAPLSFTISQSLLRFMYIDSVMLSSHLIFCHPLLFLPSIFPSIRVFSNELALRTKKPKYWNFSISHSNEYSGLISFRVDWFDLLAIQGTLESLLQHHTSKASVLPHFAFCMV